MTSFYSNFQVGEISYFELFLGNGKKIHVNLDERFQLKFIFWIY